MNRTTMVKQVYWNLPCTFVHNMNPKGLTSTASNDILMPIHPATSLGDTRFNYVEQHKFVRQYNVLFKLEVYPFCDGYRNGKTWGYLPP